MRIAIVTHNVVRGDGQGRANYEIALHALNSGDTVSLIADAVDPLLVEKGAHWIPVHPKVRGNDLVKGIEFVARVGKILSRSENDFDVVHGYGFTLDRTHHINTSQFVHSAWRQSPMHVARQNRNLYGAYQWTYSAVNAWGERRAYNKAKTVVAASHTVKNELLELGIPESRLKVILNGADLSEFYPGDFDRRALGLPENVTLALFTGDIRINRKNLDTVLKALVDVPEVHLAVVGRKEGSPFPEMAKVLGIADRVHFLDFRRDVPDIMRACDFFVFPSRYEACALVLVEASASGLPVISAKTTGGAEIITPEAGILIDDPNDVAALTSAIRALASDPERRASMKKAACETAQNNTWLHVAEAYRKLYLGFAS